MTDRLKLYNGALLEVGERRLNSLSESREPRRVCDEVWDGGFIRQVLEMGQWKFAIRSARLDYSPSITPAFGYTRAFLKSDDWIRTTGVSTDERFVSPLEAYRDEAGYLFADTDELFVSFVSDGADYGNDLTRWPGSFTIYAQTYLAVRINPRLTNSQTDQQALEKRAKDRLAVARSMDAMQGPTVYPPVGNWRRARLGGWTGRDRGSRSRLLG